LFVHLDLCIGCQAHSLACQRMNHSAVTLQSTEVEHVGNLPVVCRHCEEPACVAACPQEAMTRDDDGIVRRNAARCSGCRSCVLACPFGVLSGGMVQPLFSVAKCDLCSSRIAEGKLPACVATCPTGAIRYEEAEDTYADESQIVLGSHAAGLKTYIRRP